MAVAYANNNSALNRLKVALANSAVTPAAGNCLDGGGSNAQLVIGNSSLSGTVGVLATFPLNLPSFTFSTRTATLAGTPLTITASATGTAALAELRDSNANTIINTLTVGTTATDIIINTTSIVSGETVICTAGSIAA
jgi:hypothetical protein